MSPRRRATQVDIARAAGVSQATVSLVISGGHGSEQVAEHTRAAVLDAATRLGYSVNTAARSLKGGRNHMLGLYTFESVFPTDQRDFYYPFLLGVERATAEVGYDLLLFSSVTPGPRRIYSDGINRLKIADGCVLLGRQVDQADIAELVHDDFPFVFVGRRELPGVELSYVAPDYGAATRDLVLRLHALGHRRLAYLRPDDDQEPTRDRERGFRAGAAEAGLPDQPVHALPVGSSPPVDRVLDLLGEPLTTLLTAWRADGVTALLVDPGENDRTIAVLQQVAERAGVRIPDDLSVVVLGDPSPPPSARGSGAPLVSSRDWTRFTLPREELGRTAVHLLLDLLDDGGAARQLSVPCPQIEGDTVCPPAVGAAR